MPIGLPLLSFKDSDGWNVFSDVVNLSTSIWHFPMLFIESRGVPAGDIAKESNCLWNPLKLGIWRLIIRTFSKWPSVVDRGVEIVVVDFDPGPSVLVKRESKCG